MRKKEKKMILTNEAERQVEKVLRWIEEDVATRYPLVGAKTLEASAELDVKPELFFIANRRISFGLYTLNPIKKKEVVIISEETKTPEIKKPANTKTLTK